jgi:PKD repeat protein
MKVRLLIFLLYSTLFFGCKKFVDAPEEACFIPYVDFVAYNVDPNTLAVSFSSITSYNGTITSHKWDFGDGTTFDGETPPPHAYPRQSASDTGATYRITYTVANECGSSFWSHDVKISRCLPSVKFTYRLLNDSTVEFTNASSSSSPVSYLWDFGDASVSTSSETKIKKSYTYDGNYKVVLKATNTCGDNYFVAEIPICKKPFPLLTVSKNECGTVTLDASATVNGAKYQWNLGNGVVLPAEPSSSPVITYTYPQPGTYNIKLVVFNQKWCDSAAASTQVTVISGALGSNEEWSYTSDDLEYKFSRTAVEGATSYLWDFGDGTTSTVQNPSKTYDKPGRYTLTISASNECGTHSFKATLEVPHSQQLNNTPAIGFNSVIAFSATEIYYLGSNGSLYKTDTAGHWSAPIALPSGLVFNNNTKLFKDANGNLWIYGKGDVAKLAKESNTWTSYFSNTGLKQNATINSIAIDRSGDLWTVAGKDLQRNNEQINVKGNNQFSSIAYAPALDRIWITATNQKSLFYVNANDRKLAEVNVNEITGGADNLKVAANGDLYFSMGSGIVRTNSSGKVLNVYTSQTTGGLLSGTPSDFVIDNEGVLWVVYSGQLIKIPFSGGSSVNYSVSQQLKNISSLDIIKVSGSDNDILLAKTTSNGAVQVK